MNRYITFPKLLFSFLLFLLFFSCGTDETPIQSAPPITVTLAQPVAVTQSAVAVSGQIEAAQAAVISTRMMGYIEKMNVKAGDRVRRGQLLFSLSHNDLQAKRAQADAMVVQAEAQLNNAQKDFDRYTALFKQQSATAKEMDNIRLQYEAARAGAEAARQMRNEVNASFSYTNVVAPFDGVITAKNMDAGSMASPGMPVLMLEAAGNFRVAVHVPETRIADITTGSPATVTLKSVDRVFTGTVAEISPSSQATGGQYLVKIDIPADQYKGLYAGMYANVSIAIQDGASPKRTIEKILIPVKALVQKDQLTGIYTKSENGRAVLRWIRVGKQYGNEVEVLSGLNKEEAFIVHADGRMYNGASIVVK